MARIYLTREILDEGIALLREAGHELDIHREDEPPSRQEVIEHIREKEGLLCLLTDPIDRGVLDAAPNLKAISTYAVGYDNIDVKEATRRGIPIGHTPGVLTETTADLAWALLMAIARRIPEGDNMVRQGDFKGWGPKVLMGSDIHGKTLGIIGAGRIGRAVGRRGAGFNMEILYYSRSRKHSFEKEYGARYTELDELIATSDYISLHVPLTDDTYHLIGEKELASMKDTAYLINTARGECVDETALVTALKDGNIMGAALDVFEHEPRLTEGLSTMDNVVLAPHAGSASIETRTEMAIIAAKNLLAGLQGNLPEYCVNPEALD